MPEHRSLRHGAIVLAAGRSQRLGTSKQLLEVDAETLVHRAVRLSLGTDPAECLVVARIDDAELAHHLADLSCRIVPCAESARGLSASLRAGLQALAPDCAAALIVLVDQLAVTSAHLCALRDAWLAAPLQAAASGYADTFGVPAILPRAWFACLSHDDADLGARALLRSRRDEVQVIGSAKLAFDIDTRDDLARMNRF